MPTRRRRLSVPPPDLVAAVEGMVLFLVGLWLLVQEAELPAAEVSWPRLVVYCGMMGGPFAARGDTVRKAAKAVADRVGQEEA